MASHGWDAKMLSIRKEEDSDTPVGIKHTGFIPSGRFHS